MIRLNVPGWSGTSAQAATKAAMPPFMSTMPRPCSRSPRRSATNGSVDQPSPGGTTSRWPAKPKCGEPDPRVANRFSTGPSGGSPATKRWTSKPSGRSASSSTSNTSPEAGVTLGQATRRLARSTGSMVSLIGQRLACRRRKAMPKLDLEAIEQINVTGYPSPYREAMTKRRYRKLAVPAGLSDFGVSHVVLEPGGISSQRHWHEGEDEFVVMIEGEAVLVEEDGETALRAGDCAAFPK